MPKNVLCWASTTRYLGILRDVLRRASARACRLRIRSAHIAEPANPTATLPVGSQSRATARRSRSRDTEWTEERPTQVIGEGKGRGIHCGTTIRSESTFDLSPVTIAVLCVLTPWPSDYSSRAVFALHSVRGPLRARPTCRRVSAPLPRRKAHRWLAVTTCSAAPSAR